MIGSAFPLQHVSWTRVLIVLLLSYAITVVGTVRAAPGGAPVEAAFRVRSATPGETAVLDVWTQVHDLHVEIVRVGPGRSHEPLGGRRSPESRRAPHEPCVSRSGGGEAASMRRHCATGGATDGPCSSFVRGTWARIASPSSFPEHLARVQPTRRRRRRHRRHVVQDAGDRPIDLWRPFLDGGVPPHFRAYDRGFLHWLADRHHGVDYLADDDFERIAHGDRLAKFYDLVVFSGHEEYVTTHAYDVLRRFRDLGGNLAFLRRTTSSTGWSAADGGWSARAAGATSVARRPLSSASSTYVGTRTATRMRRTSSRARSALPGSSAKRVSRTAIASDRSESRSTRARATRRPACASSPEFPMPSAPGDRRR